jgi:hypothetical protein
MKTSKRTIINTHPARLSRLLFSLAIMVLPSSVDTAKAGVTEGQTFIITRLNNSHPIITEAMFDAIGAANDEGNNINGPSVIRIPDWIAPENRADPNAIYYMYFGHHAGNYIRLAWSTHIEGPWHLYQVGSAAPIGNRGVLDLGSYDKIYLDNGITLYNHIASPDVFVDDENQKIIMYFHAGEVKVNGASLGQKSLVAASNYGLDFHDCIKPVILGRFYFRVFGYKGNLYATSNSGYLFKAPDPNNPWKSPDGFDFRNDLWIQRSDSPFQNDIDDANFSGVSDRPLRVRHFTMRLVGDTLQVFYTRIGDCPERIMMSTIDLSTSDYELWDSTFPPREILQAELHWEGGDITPTNSQGSTAPENVNQLRDPYIFKDIDGTSYLFYCGRGEDAIGVALLRPISLGQLDLDTDTDMVDFGIFAGRWLDTGCSTCGGADLTGNGKVTLDDLRDFATYWLTDTQ